VSSGVRVRVAEDGDVEGIRDVFLAVYGADYPYESFFDRAWLRRSVHTDDIIMLVADDPETGAVLGSASVVLDVGAHSDLVGEMGRLVVHPDHRGRGVGRALMKGRLDQVRDRLHLAMVENRCVHSFSQRISRANGFAPVGFLPMKHTLEGRESVALYVRLFDAARVLRRNHPRVIPEAAALAEGALRSCGVEPDVVVDDSTRAWPPSPDGTFVAEALTSVGYPALLRVERGRVRNREIFGPMRLQYGFFKLTTRHADYLVARGAAGPDRGPGPLAGAVGFIHDDHEQTVRIFELIPLQDAAARFLLGTLLERARAWGVAYVEVDVSAHAPRMQRTLLELGFTPAAYVPSGVFWDVERLDVVKMVRLLVPLKTGPLELVDEARHVAAPVLRALSERQVLPRLAEALRTIGVFRGLDEEQATRVASACGLARFETGEALFEARSDADRLFLLLEGAVEVRLPGAAAPAGHVTAGEPLGERALLTGQHHSARATATSPVEAAVLHRDDLRAVERQRPDIGLVLYRNLAIGLGRKLARSNTP